jgi:DNA-binding LacI/PurR family transcriptional regulator
MANVVRGPSMHDVAARAGVSHQTVSRVLNGFEGIRPGTKDRVLAAITDLGYRRNVAARSLATGRSQAVGVLIPNTPDFGPTSSFYAVERALRDAGFQALSTATANDAESVDEALDFLFGRSIEALVLMAPTRAVLDVADARAPDVPVAYLLTGDERAPWSISVDQGQGVRLAIEHLVARGHTRIQHVSGPADSTEGWLRKDAFEAEMVRLDLPQLPIIDGDWSAQSGFDAGAQLDGSTTAVFCSNDQMALGLIHALGLRGIEVPRDVSVVGFDDIPEAAHMMPPLTTIRQDFSRVGVVAVNVLVAALSGEELPNTTPLPAELIERESVAVPRT